MCGSGVGGGARNSPRWLVAGLRLPVRLPTRGPTREWSRRAAESAPQSNGSTFMILALRVLTIHSVERFVVGSWAIFFESKSVGI